MGYVARTLVPGERIVYQACVHWWPHLAAVLWIATGALIALLAKPWRGGPIDTPDSIPLGLIVASLIAGWGAIKLVKAWVRQLGTELAVTTRRVVAKIGLVSRDTSEMNIEKVESVQVTQSILGRLVGYGTLTVHGTGASKTPIAFISDPLGFREAVFRAQSRPGYPVAAAPPPPLR